MTSPNDSDHQRTLLSRSRDLLITRAWWLPLLVLLGFLLLFVIVLWPRIRPVTHVETAPVVALRVADGSIPETQIPETERPDAALFQVAGWLEPDPLPLRVSALTSGVISEIHVLEGQTVAQGDPMATLVDDDAQLLLRAKQAESEAATANHSSSIARLETQAATLDAEQALLSELVDQTQRLDALPEGNVSTAEVTQARLKAERQRAVVAATSAKRTELEADVALAEARVRQAEVALEEAQLALDRTQIVAPTDGIILRLQAMPGSRVMTDGDSMDSATIALMFQPENLQVRVDVPLDKAGQVSIGQPTTIRTDLLPDRLLEGQVTRIVGEADLQRNSIQVKVRVDDPDPRLRPDVLCRVSFLPLASLDDDTSAASPLALMIPEAAIVSRNGERASVWRISEEETAERVQIGLSDFRRDDHIAVTGLLANQRVILPPFEPLSPGLRVKDATTDP